MIFRNLADDYILKDIHEIRLKFSVESYKGNFNLRLHGTLGLVFMPNLYRTELQYYLRID
jgi:hypothetical protein